MHGSDDGRRLVGIRFPVSDVILQSLKQNLATSRAQASRASATVDAITPVDSSMVKKATTAKRTL